MLFWRVMQMTSNLTQQYIKHLDSIIKMYVEADRESSDILSDGVAYGIITRSKAAVEKIAGANSHYTKDIMTIADESFHTSFKAELIIGILTALRGEIQDGYLVNISELVRGDTFNSYLEMAEHLISEGYKDAAAVIAGSTLEAHLRQLCVKHDVDTTTVTADGKARSKKASQLNQDLGKVA
jgi:hypothetical protein